MRTKIALTVLAAATSGVLAACSGGGQAPAQDNGHQQEPASHTESSGPVNKTPVDKDKAGKIATGKYGGRVLNVESDHAKGKPTWEVEIADSSKGRIEVDVGKQDGAILEMESDNDSS
ncbi:PepSY domain-containing protein [Sciscionella marina]|uniref:PepSY domain-containing protein n=1 Tax=Sciscionella marina TaxID=508770 RepID=UPI00036257D4|nr:PepSY domain-containing protein [Sciscionella marina]